MKGVFKMRRKKQDPESCNEKCEKCFNRFNCQKRVVIGYERLAFGSTADAFRLLMADGFENISVDDLDLFNVAEIKKPKDGAMEIKFFDRIKALEHLGDVPQQEEKVSAFYDVLNECSKNIGKEQSSDEI